MVTVSLCVWWHPISRFIEHNRVGNKTIIIVVKKLVNIEYSLTCSCVIRQHIAAVSDICNTYSVFITESVTIAAVNCPCV